jgi:L-amino acid N-acyltransferase YncA
MAVEIDPMASSDWPDVAEIYRRGLDSGHASFETSVPAYEEWNAAHLADLRLVARVDGAVVGWAALSPVSDRCVYGGVAEDSVYVVPELGGRGIGRQLLADLVRRAEEAGIWTIQAGIFPENTASLALHERCGFRVVGRRERLGRRHGVWRDVLLVERRSDAIG